MITLVCCCCNFDFMLYMKNKLPQVFRDATSDCLKSVGKIIDMREIEMTCIDFIGIQNGSIIIICLNCSQYQIQLTNRKRFINRLIEFECFNFKKKITHALCWRTSWKNYFSKQNVFGFYIAILQSIFILWLLQILFRMKSLHEIIFVLTIILIIFMNGEECFFGLCFGIAYMSHVYFAYWLDSYFLFQKQIKKLWSELDQVISKLHPELNKTSLQQTKWQLDQITSLLINIFLQQQRLI